MKAIFYLYPMDPLGVFFILLFVIFLSWLFYKGYKAYKKNGWDDPFFKGDDGGFNNFG